MPNRNIERFEKTVRVAATAADVPLLDIVAGGREAGATDVPTKRIIGMSVRVHVAANGTGELQIGNTADANGFMTEANIDLGTVGLKQVATGALWVRGPNGYSVPTEIDLEYTYTEGTDSNEPVFTIVILMMEEQAYLKLMA